MGVLAVAPFLLCLPLFWEVPAWSPGALARGVAILVAAAAMITWAARSELQLLFLSLPVVGLGRVAAAAARCCAGRAAGRP